MFLPPAELLDDAVIPDASFVRTQGDLVRLHIAGTASLAEINGRMQILRDYRADLLKMAQGQQ